MTTKKINPFKENKHEIIYKFINCGMAGILVFCGSLSTGGITKQGILFSVLASVIVFVTKFQHYWKTQESEYTNKLFNFVN